MPDPRSLYEEKKTTYESLVAGLHPGMLLQVGQLGGEPRGFLRALGSHGDHLRDMGIVIHNVFEPYQFLFRPDVTVMTGFLSDVTRAAAKEVGNVHYLGLQYCEGARLTRVGKNAADLFAICLGPMDDDGYFNFGLLSSSEYELTHTLAKDPRSRVLVEANAHVPHVHGFEEHGAHRIHISEIDHVVEADELLMELPAPEPSEIETRMAGHVADLVVDGATIQLGFGGLPNTIAKLLKDKRDLGAHSEMMGDGILELIECGAVTNALKTDYQGLTVSTFVLGSKKLYDWVERNDAFRLLPVLEINHPSIIARQHKMTAINNALSVDFHGQVAVHAIGADVYSGLGGIFEFCFGSMMSEGGKSILCLRSATDLPTGRVSNIVPRFPEGASVTVPEHCVDWVVTEWGAAQLRWQTFENRTKMLVSIAHPDFRDELERAAYEIGLMRPSPWIVV